MSNSSTGIPIVFIHYGKSDLLELALRQARKSNPTSRLYLLGNEANKHLEKIVTHLSFEEFSKEEISFKNIYKHFSTNPFEYEYFCFKRWFILLRFMEREELSWICTLDSDFLLYNDITNYAESSVIKNFSAAYCIPDQQFEDLFWLSSGHISVISQPFLKSYCKFIINLYENNFALLEKKIAYHQSEKISGGICDMTTFYLYYINHRNEILNLLQSNDNYVFDIGIGSSSNFLRDEFITNKTNKLIRIEKGIPFGLLKKDGEKVSFRGLHFQGVAKDIMQDYYTAEFCLALLRLKAKKYIRMLKGIFK